ncbi:3-phosphoshikimate 1-carboxyvinyltransferase [Oscillatoria amoena NRMC-F 0135]|nr:3-phosphoshikimate 1-carboxyvinyltransferase [Oscillatoria laete-virens]MDL5047507.1 3-phosphoshikimate 1-carboxyvinyltransferase [Oscillatoria amoena NRMC-F 0135]MDL5054668.1 3-phosphoshikimate 1-carboxyvinyltransferase [Oscillatoria laete-virens NRMC-F 0139]
MARQLKTRRAKRIEGELTVPGDKSISHRSAILLGLSDGGTAGITGYLPSEDCLNTLKAMAALGVTYQRPDSTTVLIEGCGGRLMQPKKTIDCGNSGTAIRLLAGVLAGQSGFKSQMTGDASLCSRPMRRIMEPLAQMGAKIISDKDNGCAPLTIEGTELKAIDYPSKVASAQVKSCLLLAGLFAKGTTSVTEPMQSRDHTERMFRYLELPVATEGLKASVKGGYLPKAKNIKVPGDISSAAFWLVAAAAFPGMKLKVTDVGLNPTRTGILNVLVRMGATIHERVHEDHFEPYGAIEITGAELKGTTIEGTEIPNVIDELPILAVAGAIAHSGVTVIRNARELRVKETDRIKAIADNLRAIGAEVEDFDDGLAVRGGRPLRGARVDSYGDHRIAMAMAVAGFFADGEMVIDNVDCIDTSYPGFADDIPKLVSFK